MWEIKKHKKITLKNPILIEGLPGIANVGKIVADYLVDQFKAELVLSFFSYSLPNSVFVNEDNLVELPRIEIFHKKIDKKDYLFLVGDVQPATELGSFSFTEKILGIAKNLGCKEILTLGGIGLPDMPEKPKVFCTGNDKFMIKKFLDEGAKGDVYGLVGPIIGVSGLLVGMSTQKNIKAAALLSETYGHPMYLGLKSAKEELKIISKVYGLKIDFKDINKEIKFIDKENKGDEELDSPTLKRLKKIKETTYIG